MAAVYALDLLFERLSPQTALLFTVLMKTSLLRRRRPLSLVTALGGVLLIAGCGSSEGAGEASSSASAAKTALAGAPAALSKSASGAAPERAAPPQQDLPRKIIYKGDVVLVAEDLDRAAEGLEREIKRFGAYIGDANFTGTRGATRIGTWTIRVPSDRFDVLLKSLPTLGELESSSRNAQDVSEEFYDAQARLKNKRVEEARLIELLKRVAGNLDQILRVETELSRIRGEIETIEGRLRYLSNLTDLSNVTVTIREVKNFKPEGPPTLGTRVTRAFTGSTDALAEFGTALLLLVVGLAPWTLPIALITFVVTRLRRPKRVPPRIKPSADEPPNAGS